MFRLLMFRLMTQLLEAMKKGQELKDPATFKNLSTLSGVIGALLAVGFSAAKIWYPDLVASFSDDDVVKISGFLAGMVMAGMGLINVVTSKKVGFGGGDK